MPSYKYAVFTSTAPVTFESGLKNGSHPLPSPGLEDATKNIPT